MRDAGGSLPVVSAFGMRVDNIIYHFHNLKPCEFKFLHARVLLMLRIHFPSGFRLRRWRQFMRFDSQSRLLGLLTIVYQTIFGLKPVIDCPYLPESF